MPSRDHVLGLWPQDADEHLHPLTQAIEEAAKKAAWAKLLEEEYSRPHFKKKDPFETDDHCVIPHPKAPAHKVLITEDDCKTGQAARRDSAGTGLSLSRLLPSLLSVVERDRKWIVKNGRVVLNIWYRV